MLSGSLEHTLRPENAPDRLVFETETTSGSISVAVRDKSGNAVFEKDNIATGTVEVEVPGEVQVTVKANRHRGGFIIRTTGLAQAAKKVFDNGGARCYYN